MVATKRIGAFLINNGTVDRPVQTSSDKSKAKSRIQNLLSVGRFIHGRDLQGRKCLVSLQGGPHVYPSDPLYPRVKVQADTLGEILEEVCEGDDGLMREADRVLRKARGLLGLPEGEHFGERWPQLPDLYEFPEGVYKPRIG